MSIFSSQIFQLLGLLLTSISATSHAKVLHKAVQASESTENYYNDTNDLNAIYEPNSTVAKIANNLAQRAYLLMQPHLEAEDMTIYANDLKFIDEFPISSYELISVRLQGAFYINDIDDTIKNFLRNKRRWEPRNQSIIRKYIKTGSIALDIGAHIGTHTVTMSKSVGDKGMVLAFEPSKHIHRELCYNLAVNKCSNTYPIRAAIGKTKSAVDVVISHPHNEGGSYVVDSKGDWNSSTQLPLDAFNLQNVSFIKIDVENMEADVLDGAQATIARNKPVMLIEIQGNGERPIQLGEDTAKMALESIKKIQDLGYDLHLLEDSVDYLALPKKQNSDYTTIY